MYACPKTFCNKETAIGCHLPFGVHMDNALVHTSDGHMISRKVVYREMV